MARLKKTMGSPDSPCVRSIRQLMATQSKSTIARWCLDYARNEILPIYEKAYPGDTRGREALAGAELWLAGSVKLPLVKKLILEAHAAAREAEDTPAAQAAMRAAAHAASVIHVASHALGIVYYGSCALVYDRLGLMESNETYEKAAALECARMEAALEAISVLAGQHPAR